MTSLKFIKKLLTPSCAKSAGPRRGSRRPLRGAGGPAAPSPRISTGGIQKKGHAPDKAGQSFSSFTIRFAALMFLLKLQCMKI